jgi:hypothetical protein
MLTSRDSLVAKERKKCLVETGVWEKIICLIQPAIARLLCERIEESREQRIRWYEIRKRYLLPPFLSNVIAFPTHITLCSSFFLFLVTFCFQKAFYFFE